MTGNLLHLVILLVMTQSPSFKQTQCNHDRVRKAYIEKEDVVKQYFKQAGLSYNGFHLFVRTFKQDQQIEVWVKEKDKKIYNLLHTYNICSLSGVLGPKRREGDLQMPEGVYRIQHFNPVSNFHLSLGINYPNLSDKLLGDKSSPGSEIYIHGNCVTVGCLPITDDKIKELYILAIEARNNGQRDIPVHIFPTRMEGRALASLIQQYSGDDNLHAFWKNLQVIYLDFKTKRLVRTVNIDSKGEYYF